MHASEHFQKLIVSLTEAAQCTKVVMLLFQDYSSITAAAAATVVTKLGCMQGCSSLTDAGLHCIGQISSLMTVSLQDCTDITG